MKAALLDSASFIAQIHASPVMTVIVVTGGGAQALADLLAVPGASRTILEAVVPYSLRSLTEFLGTPPTRYVSVETAAALATAAYQRALLLREQDTVPVIGLSCTATLITDRLKKGEHRAHVGMCNGAHTQVYSLTLKKGARNRLSEERVVSNLVLHVLFEACGLQGTRDLGLLPEEQLTVRVR